MRPDLRYIAAMKYFKMSIGETSAFLQSHGFPAVLDHHWEAARDELITPFMDLAEDIALQKYQKSHVKEAVQYILGNISTCEIVILLANFGKDNIFIAHTLKRSGKGDITPEAIEVFKTFFWDTTLVSAQDLERLAKEFSPKLHLAIKKSLKGPSLELYAEYGIIPDVSPEEYLKTVVALGYKTLFDILLGKVEVEDPVALVNAALKAAEELKKINEDATQEIFSKLQEIVRIQTLPDTDAFFDELEGKT